MPFSFALYPPAPTGETEAMAGGHEAEFGLGRVLVVVDDGHWLRDLTVSLRDGGYRVLCTSPEAARAAFLASRPDVVVHGGSGLHEIVGFTRWVRARSECAIVAVPAESQEAVTVGVLEAGADAVLSRRAGTRVVIAFLRALLRRRPARPADGDHLARPAAYGGLELDATRGVLRFPDAVLTIDEREATILGLLIGARGAVVARTELMSTLRASATELEGLMRRVRSRLESVEGWRRVTNVRSVGFRLLEVRPDPRPQSSLADLT